MIVSVALLSFIAAQSNVRVDGRLKELLPVEIMKNYAALMLSVFIVISPSMRSALSAVFKADVIRGKIELRDHDQLIECVAKKDGVLMQILCKWQSGFPQYIIYKSLETEL